MIDIREHSTFKYLLFGSLYFTEGLNKVIAVMILPIYFLEKGIPPEMITLVIGIAAIPIIIKFVWGGITDYYIQYGRKRFILLGGALSIISLIILAFVDPGDALVPFAIFVSFCWCGVGFLDVSADAWAIEISKEKERGKINGAMYAGQNSGMAIGALLLPIIAKIFDYKAVFLTSALIIFIIILFPLLIKEIKIVKKRQKLAKLIIREFKKKTTIMVTFLAITFGFSAGMLLFIAPIYMDIGLKLDLSQIGLITMAFTVAMAIGSLTGGVLSDKWGRNKAIFLLMMISVFFSALLIFTDTWENFIIIYAVIGFLQGGYFAAALALFMDVTNPRVGATQFSIFMGLGNFGNIGIAMISGTLYAMLGFDRVFLYSAWLFGPALLILYFIRLKKPIKNSLF
jgi:PAT family beta-lactamase induction signal transducer AmpG